MAACVLALVYPSSVELGRVIFSMKPRYVPRFATRR